MATCGYARVSTEGQDHTGKLAQLEAAGCEKVCRDKLTGATADRPQLKKLIAALSHGYVVIIPAVDRLARDTTDLLRSVAGERNLLVHAHFEQSPIDGSYELVNGQGQTAQHYAPQRIDGVASRIQKVWMALRYAEAFYEFADHPLSVNASPT